MKSQEAKKEQRKLKSDSTAPKVLSEYQKEKSSKSSSSTILPKK